MSPPVVRLAHVSDVHVNGRSAWRRSDWLSKRLTSWLNLRLLGRGRGFRQVEPVLTALAAELDRQPPDCVVFSGDATALGFEEECVRAARLLRVGQLPGIAVPGNHDYCTRAAMRAGHFERAFAPWLVGERVGPDTYPFAQRVGPLWLVAVNSATANRWAWDARGLVGAAQLARLETLLARLDPGPRVLVTHYPVGLASGRPEKRGHGLRDLDELVRVAAAGGVCLWLHGHRHDAYHHPGSALAPFAVICSGSATQSGRWSYNDYTIDAARLVARQRVYDPAAAGFRDGLAFELDLPV